MGACCSNSPNQQEVLTKPDNYQPFPDATKDGQVENQQHTQNQPNEVKADPTQSFYFHFIFQFQVVDINDENKQEFEKSAVKIQSQFRGTKARKVAEEEKIKLQDHYPKEDEAKKCEKEPQIENMQVKNTLEKLGPYEYNKEIDKDFTECCALPPFVDFQNKILYIQQFESGAIYVGQWYKGQKQGRGKQYWPDGSIYEGYWQNNTANGKGRLIHADGDAYVSIYAQIKIFIEQGDWKDDRAQGYGTYYHVDGAKYEGYWLEDQQHGDGKETWPDGAQYTGQYQNGKKEGQGKFQWSDGATYEGDFKNNNIDGIQIQVMENMFGQIRESIKDNGKTTKCMGKGFLIGQMERNMKVVKNNEIKNQKGEYVEDKKEGYGVFQWQDGRMYKGNWKEGKQHGQGILVNKNGEELQAEWVDGKRIKSSADDAQRAAEQN